jgi:putative hydrolase
LQVAEFTQLPAPGDLAPVEAVRRAQWVEANIEGLKEFMEPSAAKVAAAFEAMAPGGELGETAAPAEAMMGKITPLLLGTQAGAVLGALGQQVLAQYDIALPRPRPGRLIFVMPNIAQLENDWSLPPREFREWIALHEVTHRFEFARPWARTQFLALLNDFVSTLEIDTAGIREQVERLDPSNPEELQNLLRGDQEVFGAVLDEEQRLKLARIQAFMAAAEGYGDHVMHSLGKRLLGSYTQIDEAMRRYRETETGDPVFERLLGIEMKREQYRLGRAFCDSVVELTDEATLGRMWDSPEALPSLPEIAEPRLWLARTV